MVIIVEMCKGIYWILRSGPECSALAGGDFRMLSKDLILQGSAPGYYTTDPCTL